MTDTVDKVSKTQKKREANALLELGRELTGIPENSLVSLQLDPKLRNAIDDFKKLHNTRGAKKRQLHYIGRLLRENQDETLLIQVQQLSSSPKQSQRPSLVDKIFERVITEGDQAINETVSKNYNFDRQKLRQLKSNISKASSDKRESAENKLKAYIKLISD